MLELASANSLAPSELVLLNAGEIARSRGLSSFLDVQVDLQYADARVSAFQLGQTLLAIALLANEQAQTIRLEPRDTKSLFGLHRDTALWVEPGNGAFAWPPGSLEAQVRPTAEALKARGRNRVANVVYGMLPAESLSPWRDVVHRVEAGLEGRGLLEVREIKRLGVFASKQWMAPEHTDILATRQQAATPKALLETYQRERIRLWRMLMAEIRDGVFLAYPQRV